MNFDIIGRIGTRKCGPRQLAANRRFVLGKRAAVGGIIVGVFRQQVHFVADFKRVQIRTQCPVDRHRLFNRLCRSSGSQIKSPHHAPTGGVG